MNSAPKPNVNPDRTPGAGHAPRPSVPWWVAALITAIAGLVVGTAWAAMNMLSLVHRPVSFPHTPVPGSVVIDLAEGEQAVAYIEAATTIAARTVDVTVRTSDDAVVATRPYPGLVQYDVEGEPGRLGLAVRFFEAPAAGRYTVTAVAVDRSPGSTLAAGEDISEGLLTALLPPVLLALGLLVLAGVLALTPLSRRSCRTLVRS